MKNGGDYLRHLRHLRVPTQRGQHRGGRTPGGKEATMNTSVTGDQVSADGNQEDRNAPCARRLDMHSVQRSHDASSLADLQTAIIEFEKALPGWWYSLGICSVSRDASCGPDITGPDAALLKIRKFDSGYHCDCLLYTSPSPRDS